MGFLWGLMGSLWGLIGASWGLYGVLWGSVGLLLGPYGGRGGFVGSPEVLCHRGGVPWGRGEPSDGGQPHLGGGVLMGSLWGPMGSYGVSMGLYGSLWESMRLYGSLWESMGVYGVLMGV